MSKKFQLDLMSMLLGPSMGLSGMGMTSAPPEVHVNDETLTLIIEQATNWIKGDQSFRLALEAGLKSLGKEPSYESIYSALETACNVASTFIRSNLSGKRFDGFWPIAEGVLKAVINGQIQAYLQLGLHEEAKAQSTEQAALLEIKKMAKMLSKEKEVLDKVGHALVKGMKPSEALNALAEVVRRYHEVEILRKNRSLILSMSRNLMLDGKVKRFELGTIAKVLLMLEEWELNRKELAKLLEELAKNTAVQRVAEVKNPWNNLGGE